MVFILLYYLLFISGTGFFYYSVNNKYKIYVLFLSSLLFIAAFSVQLVFFALVFTFINYFSGLLLEKHLDDPVFKTRLFWMIILLDIGILGFFKYFDFFSGTLHSLSLVIWLPVQIQYLPMVIPIGLSYYTFQAMGYIIRINRRSEKAERRFGAFAVYLLFFPKLISGPVERSNHFFPQIKKMPVFDKQAIFQGSRLFMWGLFKKIVIADQLYQPLFQVYHNVHAYSGLPLLMVLLFQTIYIYTDFSGYTDMALGSAKIFGINLVDNFNRPFLARTVSEYWKRWHISLSSWCNDFIYNAFIVRYRKWGNRAVIAGLFLTFFVMGIWHGANINFIILGMLQGIIIVYEYYTKGYRLQIASRFPKNWVNTVSRILVFFFMSFSMVFFFAGSFADAGYFISHLTRELRFNRESVAFISQKSDFILSLLIFSFIFVFEILTEKGNNLMALFLKQPVWIRCTGYLACLLLICYFQPGIADFYYARF